MLLIEFIDSEIMKAIIMLMLAFTLLLSSLNKKNKAFVPRWAKGVYLFLALAPFLMAAIAMSNAEDNINKFHQGERLFCTADKQKYIVTKQSGWRVEGVYFIKESLLIRGDSCEQYK